MNLDIKYVILIVVIACLITYYFSFNDKRGGSETFAPTAMIAWPTQPIVKIESVDRKLLITKMRTKLWVEYLIYMRLAMMAMLEADADTAVMIARIKLVPKDFGVAISQFYSKEAGNAVDKILSKHVEIVIKIIETIKIDSNYDKNLAINELYVNADQIGTYLDALNGNNEETFKRHMKIHTDNLLANISAYVSNNYSRDITTLDNCIKGDLNMVFAML